MFDLDGAVNGQLDGLIEKMRARRLSAELPPPTQALPPEPDAEAAPDDSGDLAALESMLDSE